MVIDCQTRQIVDLGPEERYLALSYVWGSPQLQLKRENSTSLSPSSVQVVEDAMLVVNRFKVRFLWVNQYCIDPDQREN